MPHCSDRPGSNTLCFICEICISVERTNYRNVQPYSVMAILSQNYFSIVLTSFLSHLSFSTSSPFPAGSSFFFLCYDRGRKKRSKKSSFKKHPRCLLGWHLAVKPKSHSSNPSNMRCSARSAAGIKPLFCKKWVEIW